MRAFVKTNRLISLVFWLVLVGGLTSRPAFLHAEESIVEVKEIDFALRNDRYYVSANIRYRLTQTAREALDKGIPLYWDVLIKVVRERHWLWNQTLVDFKIRYRIEYHALLNNYRVTNITSSDSKSYSSLSAALNGMSSIQDIAILERKDIEPDQHYHIGVKSRFDREALPLPLRPSSYINPQWYLSSDWLIWPVQN